MNRELLFVKALEEVKKLARRQSSSYGSGNRYGSYISREQLEEAFSELGLDEEQLAWWPIIWKSIKSALTNRLSRGMFLPGRK